MWIVCSADDSHGMLRNISIKNIQNKIEYRPLQTLLGALKQNRMSSATYFAWLCNVKLVCKQCPIQQIGWSKFLNTCFATRTEQMYVFATMEAEGEGWDPEKLV